MIKIFKTKFNKLTALLTATSLLISFVVGPTAASAINNEQTTKEYSQIFKEFILPYSYGKITKSHFAGTDRVIINIQDLHCHPKVQKNISNIIKIFDEKYGVNNIYLEGAYGNVSTKWITDQTKKNKNLLEKMLDTGRLTGAEYYSALSEKTEIIKGLEEKEPYLDNITRLGSILDSQEKIDLILKSLDESVNEVKKRYYTKRQYKIEHLFKEYKAGKINSQKYYTLLSKHIDKLGIDLTKYENTLIYVTLLNSQKDLNYKQITKELQSLIAVLKQQLPYNAYKSLLENTSNFQEVEKLYSYIIQLDKVYNLDISLKFTELDKYFKYVELSKKINPVELVKEDEFLSQEMNTRFSQTPAQKDVVFLVHFGRYLKDYVTTKITLEDYKYYKENIEQYRKIYKKYVDNRVLSLLDEYIAQIDKFYEINMDRNFYFTKNMFEENEQFVQIEQVKQAFDDINKIISNMDEVKRVDVVVTGGFHSQTVTELLEQQNVSYIVITPNVTDGIKLAEETYYELAKEQSKISFQTIAPVIASLSPQLQSVLLNKIEREDTEKIEQIMKMDEAERAQIIADLAAAKLLESDDLGDLEETLNEIVENLVDEYHKEKVTPELVSKIKNLQSLLKNKEKLQKVIDLLSVGTAKQSVMLVSDMFDDIYEQLFGILPSFADKERLEKDEDVLPLKDFDTDEDFGDSDIDKDGAYEDDEYYGYDVFDSLELWFSNAELIELSREIIKEGQYNENIEKFIEYLGRHNMADYELLSKVLAELKSINNSEIKKEYCGVLYALTDKKVFNDKQKAVKNKEDIMSFLEKPRNIQLRFCELFPKVFAGHDDTVYSFFTALLDCVNENEYTNTDFDFLVTICRYSFLVTDLETKENMYNFLTLNIEKRRLLYSFYQAPKVHTDIEINRVTLNFMLSVLHKYNLTDEQFNYIMKLICSVNITKNTFEQKYVNNLKEKELNIFVLENFKYINSYSRYLLDLIFSDVEETKVENFVSKLQKIVDLFDDLQEYKIDTLDTENKCFALEVFLDDGFEAYCKDNNINDLVKQYQLAIRVSRKIYSILGDKISTTPIDKMDNIIKKTLEYYKKVDKIISFLTLFTNKTAIFSLHNNERNPDKKSFRFTPDGIKEILKRLEIEPEVFESIEISFMDKVLDFIRKIEQDEIDKQVLLDFVNNLDGSVIVKKDILEYLAKKENSTIPKKTIIRYVTRLKISERFVEVNRYLKHIEHFNDYGQEKGVFIFDGHGASDGKSISYSETGSVTVHQIAQALINAHNNGVNLENLTLVFASCHSYKFADNIINELIKNGIDSFPQILTDAGKETIYGYTKAVDMDGKQTKVSNLFYSLLKLLDSKTQEEIEQMKGSLSFKDVADAPRYLSNNTVFVTNQEINKLNNELEADILGIINEQESENTEAPVKNDVAYAGRYRLYAEMMLPSTQKALNDIGNIGIIKAVYKEKSGENFRFTTLGVALGVLIETFSFWSPNFIKAHNFDPSIQAGMTAVVWTVRALSIGIGIWTGSIFALFLTETITHFIWNTAVILVGRQDLLLQTSKAEGITISKQKSIPQRKWTMNNISKEAPYTEKYKLVYYIFEKTCRQMDIEFPEEQEFIIINNIIDAYDSSFWEIMDFENWVYEHFITDIIDFQQKQSRLTDALSKCFPDDIEDILWIFSQCLSKSKVPMFTLNNIIDVANDLEKTNNIHFSEEVYAVLNILKRYNTSETEQILVNMGLIKVPNALYKKAMDDIQFKQLEESIRENEGRKTIILSEMMLPSTQKALNDMGNTGIIKAIYKEKAGENFRFTTLGVALGVLIETFSFWSPNFIKAHNFDPSIQAGMTAVVWTVRALSIGIGIWTGSIFALFLTETITHFVWNTAVILVGRQDLLLQTSNQTQSKKTQVIVPPVKAKEKARDLTREEQQRLKDALFRTKVRIKNSTLEIREENDKNLAIELQNIFDALLDSMVDLGKIDYGEKGDYELILYLSDEVNAFTVSGSKTVFISTGMLHSLATYLNGKIGKEHVAAILAHELEHTTQDKKIYNSSLSRKGDQKKNEYDSDIQAVFMLDNAGYNPISVQDLMEFLNYLEEKTKYRSTGLNKILDAHPDAGNRLIKIKTFLSDRNIFLRNTTKPIMSLENSIPYLGEENLGADIHGELGYYKKGVGPRDSNGFIKEILNKYGDKIALYKILERFNAIDRFVNVNDILEYINSSDYPFFNDKIKNFSNNQKKVIFRLMNSFDNYYPSNAEIYELCPDMNELKEIFDFIIEPENYFFFFENISFLNISYLVAALYNSGSFDEKDYDKIQKFLSINEDNFSGLNTFHANIDKDTVDFYVDKFELFDNFKKYALYSELKKCLSKEKNFSESQREKLRKFFFTPDTGGTAGYHMFRGLDFFELLYPGTTFESYVNSIAEEQKQKILEEAEKKEIEDYNLFTQARNREVLGEKYDPAKEAPGVTSMYEIYKHSSFASKKFKEKFGSRWDVPYEEREDNWHEIWDEKERKWLSENDDALFAEWLQNKKDEWFRSFFQREYNSLMLEKYESELFAMLGTLEEKLEFLFPGGLMEFRSRFTSNMDYETSIPKILKKDIEDIKNKKELFNFIDAIINHFDKQSAIEKTDLDKTVYILLSNVDREIINNFTIKDIQKLFELSILNEMSNVTELLTVALIVKRKDPKSFDFDKIFSICDYSSKKHNKSTFDFVQNVMDKEQLLFLFSICDEKGYDLSKLLPHNLYSKIIEKFDEVLSLEEKYRYSIYKDNVYPYSVYQKIKNENDLKEIPIEHLKRFLGIKIPIHKDSFMNHSFGRIGIKDSFALRILQNKVEQYQQNFRKSFYDVKNFSEFEKKVKEIEEVFYPWSNVNVGNGNEIFSNEVDMVWANLLHNMCGFGLDTKSFVFVNIHGEELLNVWCELTPNYDFVPTVQQTNELLEAFTLIKKYLPKEQSVAYARMLYEMIGKNKNLSVFESVERNLELLDFFFEGFSEIKDDYIYELLENYDIDVDTYNKCLRKTTYYAYKDETEDTGKNFLYREVATVLSNDGMTVENKIKFIAWLISDKQEKPEFLKKISVKNDYEGDPVNNRRSLGEDAKIDIFRNYFWSMTKSERAEYIRELLTDIFKDGTEGKGKDYEKLKNTLADAFFDSIRNDDNGKIIDALKMSFKIILDSLASHEYKSTSERQILFINDLIDSLVSISKSNFSPKEKEARQIGRFIVAMGAASGVAVVKILQILSNSKAFDGLGEQGSIINEEISRVRSSNEQLSKRVVFQQLETLGMLQDVESVGKCLGAASIGVTYLINMKDGSKRIIKIKRPSVLKNYKQDLIIADRLIDFFKFSDILPQNNKNMIPTIEFLEQVFSTELNFEDEVDNLLRAKANLSLTPISTPDVVGNYNSDSFMQTLASGKSFDNAKSTYSEQERSEIYSKILLEFFREVFMDGFFHADLHEGNIFINENKDITFIDWGACGYVEESKRDDLETVFVALLLSDSINFMEALKQYDTDLYNRTSVKSEEIVKILDSNDNLETKFGRIFTVFNQIDMSQNHDFLMFIQGLSKVAKYIDNLSLKEKILLLLDDTVVYDLLQNKNVLANIYSLLEKTIPNRYINLIKFALAKLVKSNEENLRNIITDIKLFIINSDDDALEKLIRDILKTLNLSSAFEMPLKFLISKRLKQLSNISGVSLQKKTLTLEEKKRSEFKFLDFIKRKVSDETETKKDEIEFVGESKPVSFLIQKGGTLYTVTMELDSLYREDNNKDYIDIGLEGKKLMVYLSSIGKESFSKEISKYTSIDSIEELLGIKINISGNTVSVTSEDTQTDIKYVKHENISEIISDIKGQPIKFLQEEPELLKDDSGCDRVEYLFLDQDMETIENKIETAINDNNTYAKNKVLFVLYPFSNVYDIDSLSDEQIFALYLNVSKSFDYISQALLSRKHLYRIDDEEIDALRFSVLELLQKAFFSGSASLSKPIYISCVYDGSDSPNFTVYRKLGDETINEKQRSLASVVTTGNRETKTIQYYQDKKLLTATPQEKAIRRIGKEGKYYTSKIVKEFRMYYEERNKWGDLFSLDDDLSMELDDFDDDFAPEIEGFDDEEDSFERLEESAFMDDKEKILDVEDKNLEREPGLASTRKFLDDLGNIRIVKKIYKDNSGKNFKFTRLGVAIGSTMEVIPFFLPTFINDHNFDSSVKTKMIAVVWVIRALTIGIGFITGSIQIAILSNIIIHSVWNRFVILIGRQDLLLQLSKEKSKNEETNISDETEKQSDFISLMSRVFDNIETIENINSGFESDRDKDKAQREAEAELIKIFTAEELETIDLLASVVFDSIKYVNSTRNTSSVEFVNIAYALQNGLFNSNILPKEGEDLKQHILDMLRHYIEVSKQKKGEDNLLVRIVNSNKNLLNDMADYLADIIVKNNLVEKNKIENEKRKINIQKFIDGVKGDDKLFSAVMICSANENRSAIWHIMFKDFLEKHGKRNTKVFSAGVFYDISQRFMNEEKTDKTKPLVDDYIETLSLDERYKNINENLRDGFRSRYIEYLKLPKNSQPVFIVAGEQHRAQLIKLGYDSSWIFLMSDFYSDEFKKGFKQKNKVLGQQLEDNNIFAMSEFPDPFENQILRQDLPELVRSVVEYNFEGEPTPQQLPEQFRNLTDDYNQFEHMEGLPDFSDGKNPRESMELEEGRQKAIQSFNEQIEDISSQNYQFIFRGNTKYLYLLQNRKNKYILLNIASQPNIDLKFRLFALLYLDKLRHELTSEETTRVAQAEKAVAKRLKKQIENNEFEVLNNLDLRAYMMGVYLILRDYADKISVPDIINRAIIINPSGKTMARDDGLFAKVDLFIVIHELAHRIFYKPQNRNEYVSDPLDELVSYIVPNMFLRKIINLSLDVYSESQNLYTIHHADGVIDYIKMGKKFHSLYSMFDKNAEEYKFKQEEHSAPIAFLDYLFAVHQKAGKTIDWDVLLDVIRDLSLNKLDQLKMFRRILDLYMKRSIEKGSLTKEETEVMKKEIEEMQVWTILVKEVIEIIESTSPNTFNLLKGNKDASVYKTEILSKTKEMKESFEELLKAFTWNIEFSKSELLVLLIMNIMKNVEYEQLENNFGGVINGIIDVINKASGELKLDLNKDKYSQQEYRQILNFVLMYYTTSKHVETSVTNDIYTYISKNLDYLSFATKLINMVFGTRDLTKIFSNKKLLIATSKEQEENFRKLLSGREDVAVVTMEVKKDRVYDIREGSFLDVQRGIKATYDSKENKIIVYSKEGINITEDEIKILITEQYFSERKDDLFDDVIAFADVNDSSLQDITDRLNIAYTESVSIPNKETTFDLSSRIFMKNIVNVCEQESEATGIKTFIITFDQAKEFPDEIQTLQERDFKFIVSCKIDAISNIKYYDGLIIDDSKTDYEDISQLLPVMEKVRKHVLKTGVAKPVSVKFSNSTYGKFNSAGINIFDTYGMLPIVEDSYITNSMIGKFMVEKIRDNNMERFLRQNNVVGFVIDNARTFVEKKGKLRDLFSNEHKYNRGYNASLSSKIDYTCDDVSLLAEYLNIDINNTEELNRKINKLKENLEKDSSKLSLSLTHNSRVYLKSLLAKTRYEEVVGFIRGVAMNSARTQIIKGLNAKEVNLDMDKFAKEAGGKYQKAFLTVAVQLMMEDIDITELLETDFIDSDMTVKQYLDSVYEKVNINIEDILKQNEFKIERAKDTAKTIEDFKNYVVLLDNLKIVKETTANFDMSMKAVRSMLSAA